MEGAWVGLVGIIGHSQLTRSLAFAEVGSNDRHNAVSEANKEEVSRDKMEVCGTIAKIKRHH